jgi:cytidylate kinase
VVNIVTLEREYGCGGGAIASMLAQRLGYKLWDEAISAEIAKRLHCDVRAVEQREERLDPTYYRLVKTFMRGSYEDRTGARLDTLDADGLSRLFESIIDSIGKEGKGVIVGRGSAWFMRGRPDVYHVFLYASREEKLRRILASGRSDSEAEDLLERVDRDRAAFVKKYYDMNWPTRALYHLMVNTIIGDEAVVDLVLQQAAAMSSKTVAISS